ncbi:hypothetical protein AVEN_77864-1 [Araneus ventricosus]|uniref:Uncharacterized protein n=1 Tax=Araneus ventricosus TaxID=182803 RepID=A0A4Y2R0C7_ARAVE|nr:hypothetical protein AVEN_77864-1 [Araneus ventricosus]
MLALHKQGIANAYHSVTNLPIWTFCRTLPSPNPAPPNFDPPKRKINNDNYPHKSALPVRNPQLTFSPSLQIKPRVVLWEVNLIDVNPQLLRNLSSVSLHLPSRIGSD